MSSILVLSRTSEREEIDVSAQRRFVIEAFPSVNALLVVAEEFAEPFPIQVLLAPVVMLLPALKPMAVLFEPVTTAPNEL